MRLHKEIHRDGCRCVCVCVCASGKINKLYTKQVSSNKYCVRRRFPGLSRCCDSALSDMAVTPDASAMLDEVVEGNNNCDTCGRHSKDSRSGDPVLISHHVIRYSQEVLFVL